MVLWVLQFIDVRVLGIVIIQKIGEVCSILDITIPRNIDQTKKSTHKKRFRGIINVDIVLYI